MKKLLALCDSPTAQTGFARVAQNLLPRWLKANGGPFDEINVWGINYNGERHNLPFWIYSAGGGADWQSVHNLTQLIYMLSGNAIGEHTRPPYTHIWMMQDSFCLSGQHQFPEGLKNICATKKIRSVYYMPVDARLEPEWMDIVQKVDATVAYTEFGKAEALKALPAKFNPASIGVIPHGCDTSIYRPLPDREEIRERLFCTPGQKRYLEKDDFLIVNVNMNQRRKAIPDTFRILAELKRIKKECPSLPRFMLFMHMARLSADNVDMVKVAGQLGLVEGEDWLCADKYFVKGHALLGEYKVAEMYNVADLMLTTTLGEGWGFCLTEALGCGCPIAAPAHTSCREIMDRMATLGVETPILPLEVTEFGALNAYDNSRFRATVDVKQAAWQIAKFAANGRRKERHELPAKVKEWLDWSRIAKQWEAVLDPS